MARRSKENAIDWDAIEKQWKLGQKSNKQLAEEFGIQPSTIGRRSEKFGWVQDKAKDVEATTSSLLIQAASGNANPNATPSALQVKAAAQANADVILSHRSGLMRESAVAEKLLTHIESAIDEIPTVSEILAFIREASPEESENGDKAFDLLRKAASRGALVDDFKKVVESRERIRKGQREAFGIDKDGDKPAFEYEAILRKVNALKQRG